ncbi:MAG: sugar kinase [Eubacteriales bacterium]|nr:sugar kinase [Eubacteriales bacterium]
MKFITMGEIMLRLMTPGFLRIEQTDSFRAVYDGDEAIVAVSLARFGMDSCYISKLPYGPLGEACLKRLRAENVDCRYIVREEGRLGINFYETGASVRPPRVLYDRQNSVFSKAKPEDFPFEEIFEKGDWFHFTGITPAISKETEILTEYALKMAKKKGVTVSCDLNYRAKLWSAEKAQEVMKELMPYVDVCIANSEDARIMLGMEPESIDMKNNHLDMDGYRELFPLMREKYGFRYIGCTLREGYSASDNGLSVLGYDGRNFHRSKHYDLHLVDRGGGGASFAAGFIYGLAAGMPLTETVEFAGAASAIKHTVYGGLNLTDPGEVRELMEGTSAGRVQR